MTDTEHTDVELTDAEVVDLDLTSAEAADAEVTDAEVTDLDLTSAEVTDAEVTNAVAEADAESSTEVQPRRHTAVWAAVGAVVLLVALGGIAVAVLSGGGDSAKAKPKPNPVGFAQATGGVNVSAELGRVPMRAVSTNGNDIPVFAAPDDRAAPMALLSTITGYDMPRTLLAFDQYGNWMHVFLPIRPNSSTGWVRAADVNVSAPLEWQVRVSLADHHVWLLHNGVVEWDAGIAIGSDQYPTPTGRFYITDPVDLHATPNLGYGVFALGLSGHSDVLSEFGGGDGQIALHGTNNPGDIGLNVSHGCVRMLNESIERLSTLPLGTPVIIT